MTLRGTAHFSVGEALRASGGFIPPDLQQNAQNVLQWLEAARGFLGRPILITSLYRSPEHNATVAGSSGTSQHMRALGADFDVIGMANHVALAALVAGVESGALPAYHQLITYEADHHVHVGIIGEAWGDDRQNLLKLAAGGYRELDAGDVAAMRATNAGEVVATTVAQATDAAANNPIAALAVVAFFLAPAIVGGHWT